MKKYKLSQERLDVVRKTRSNIFDWRGQFTPDFIEYLLCEFAKPGDVIADPFSGSGTVLLEATKLGNDCYGFEINPSAYFMSKFYEYSNYTKEGRDQLMAQLRDIFGIGIRDMQNCLKVYVEHPEYREAYKDLLDFAKYCKNITPNNLLPFIINVLFLCERDKKLCLRDSLIKNFNALKAQLYNLPYSHNYISANWADARSINKTCNENVNLIITSPPYINVFNYHQNYRGIIECFDFDLLQVANSEIGSNRKNRQNRFKTVIQYAIDMGHVLQSCKQALVDNGIMIWVVGRTSNVRKVPFSNSSIVKDLIQKINGLELEDVYYRKFGNRYGEEIIEDILIIRKTSNINLKKDLDTFEEIGINHLRRVLDFVSDDVKPDLETLIYNTKTCESPILVTL